MDSARSLRRRERVDAQLRSDPADTLWRQAEEPAATWRLPVRRWRSLADVVRFFRFGCCVQARASSGFGADCFRMASSSTRGSTDVA